MESEGILYIVKNKSATNIKNIYLFFFQPNITIVSQKRSVEKLVAFLILHTEGEGEGGVVMERGGVIMVVGGGE